MTMVEEPIDSRQMQIFVALARGGNLKAAAGEIGVTESAVSHAIRNLETNLGLKLCQRAGKGLQLTEDGKVFLRESLKILASMGNLRSRLEEGACERSKEIRLACAPSFIQFALPSILPQFLERSPGVKLKIVPADRESCLSQIERGEAAAAVLVNLPQDSDRFEGVRLFGDELKALMSARHELAECRSVPVRKLFGESVYLQNQNSYTSRMILWELQRRAFQPKNVTYVNNSEALRQLIRLNLGISFQPLWAYGGSLASDEFAWRPVEGVALKREWYFAWSRDAISNIHVRSLLMLCEEWAQRFHSPIRTAHGSLEPSLAAL